MENINYEHISLLHADVVADNLASDKILKKFGFEYTYSDENIFEYDGKKSSIKHYKLEI